MHKKKPVDVLAVWRNPAATTANIHFYAIRTRESKEIFWSASSESTPEEVVKKWESNYPNLCSYKADGSRDGYSAMSLESINFLKTLNLDPIWVRDGWDVEIFEPGNVMFTPFGAAPFTPVIEEKVCTCPAENFKFFGIGCQCGAMKK